MPAPRRRSAGSARYWQLGTPVHGWVKPQKRVKRLCTFSCRLPAVGRNRALVRGVLCYSMRSPARRLARRAPAIAHSASLLVLQAASTAPAAASPVTYNARPAAALTFYLLGSVNLNG